MNMRIPGLAAHAVVLWAAVWAWASDQTGSTALTPIARWTTVPYQRIGAGQSLNCGVVAFSKNGISEVRFTVSGEGYSGPESMNIKEMSLNDQTGVYEYWIPVQADYLSKSGVITVEATVYGGDGGVRDKTTDGGGVGLDPLKIIANSDGRLPQMEAWVSHQGADGSGVVNELDAPFQTVGGAIQAIRCFRREQGFGDNADGGIIRLVPSDTPYVCSRGKVKDRVPCPNEWLTITTGEEQSGGNAVLATPASLFPVEKVCLRRVTLLHNGSFSLDDPQWCSLWIDQCTLIGDGQGVNQGHPLLRAAEYQRVFYTDSTITQLAQATSGAALCRGLTISHISDDAFQNVPLVVNCKVDDMQPIGPDGSIDPDVHADAWQHWGGNEENHYDDNIIVYGLTATNLGYQNLFVAGDVWREPSFARGMAFVNVYLECNQVPELQNRHGGWSRWVDHLLWWNCSMVTQGVCIGYADYHIGDSQRRIDCRIKNFSCVGSDLAFLRLTGSDAEIDWSGWNSNHFVAIDEHQVFVARGTNYTTGDHMLDASGIPLVDSPLVQRFPSLVPVDAGNRERGPLSDIGAFQHIPPRSEATIAPVNPQTGSSPQPAEPRPEPAHSLELPPLQSDSILEETNGSPSTCGLVPGLLLPVASLCLALLKRRCTSD